MNHFLSYSHNHLYKYDPIRRCIIDKRNNRSLPGLTSILKTLYWPRYSYHLAVVNNKPRNEMNDLRGYRPHETGRQLGLLIDREISWSVKLFIKYHLTSRFFYIKSERLRYRLQIPINIMNICHNLHTYTKRFWKEMYKRRWIPIASQIGVGCWKLHVASLVDVICIDQDGLERVLEIKVGGEGYYYKSTAFSMNYPFNNHNDSEYHKHMIQAAFENELFLRTYRKSNRSLVGNPLVCRITFNRIMMIPIEQWIVDSMRHITVSNQRLIPNH